MLFFCDIIIGMKTRILIFSSLLCMYGAVNAQASDCTGAGCDIEPLRFEEFEWTYNDEQPIVPGENTTAIVVAQPAPVITPEPVVVTQTWMESDPNVAAMPAVRYYAEPVTQIQKTEIPVRNVKLLSIKPVPEDGRPALWDGVHGKYTGPDADKTVSWKDGVPIWDESIASYRYKDFSDWYLEAAPEIYVREIDETEKQQIDPVALYQQNMEDAATTRARVEELLAPRKPSANLWFANNDDCADNAVELNPNIQSMEDSYLGLVAPKPEYVAQDMTEIVQKTFYQPIDGCPFETETECQIWRRKPIVREVVSPRSAKLRDAKIDEFIHAADCNKHITANEPVSAPLLDRYKMLMRSAQACCTDGMAYALKQAGASDGLVYKFLSDDANFYGFGSRCLMMTDHDLDTKYPNTATAVVAADVRNGCLCRGRQWFQAMLAPFEQAYNAMPEFKNAQFNYTYKDGLQREITVSINNDVQNVLKQLAQCP